MSAAAIFDPLADLLNLEPADPCRFCGCTPDNPCWISIVEERDGKVRLARNPEEAGEDFPCSWYVRGVCNAPSCLEKLIAESRVLLFAADGRKLA